MWAWSCSFTKHELHLRVTAKCCKSFFLALKTRFTPLQSFSCACKLYLRLQSYVHFHKSYHTHANLLGVKLPSYNPFRKERRDRSEVMLIRPQQAHESSTNASSACWKPRHWRQRSCPSSTNRKRPQPEGHGRNGILKKTRSSMICSFRIFSLSWSAQGNRQWEGLRWSHRYAIQEQNKDERLCGDQHSSHPLGSEAKV